MRIGLRLGRGQHRGDAGIRALEKRLPRGPRLACKKRLQPRGLRRPLSCVELRREGRVVCPQRGLVCHADLAGTQRQLVSDQAIGVVFGLLGVVLVLGATGAAPFIYSIFG